MATAILLAGCVCCSPTARSHDIAVRHPLKDIIASENHDDIHAGVNGTDYTCIVNRDELLIIADFYNKRSYPRGAWVEGVRIKAQVSERFRAEARASLLRLSDDPGDTLAHRLMSGCTAPFDEPFDAPFDEPMTSEDAVCMAAVARQLNARWLLSGLVDPIGDHYVVDAQLASAVDPTNTHTVRFSFSEVDLSTAVHSAWKQLVSAE